MKQIKAHINPRMIKWAREKSGFDINGAAKKINNVKPEKLKAWEDENNPELPTINQAMKMAEVYKRPLSLFYLDEPPRDFSVKATDFRRHVGEETLTPSPALLWEKRYAEIRHHIALDLAESEEEDQTSPKRIFINPDEDPVLIAQKIRNWLGITWGTQRKWKNSSRALNAWKEAIENKEFLVFHTKHYKGTVDESEVKGFALNFPRFPVIVLNVKDDSPNAPIFTLMHELTHLLISTSGFCDCWEHRSVKTPEHQKEVFCNRIAGEVLVPKEYLLNHDLLKVDRERDDWNDGEIISLSREFVTSRDVIVRRLLILGVVSRKFYEKKHEQYNKEYFENREKRKEEIAEEDDFKLPHFRSLLKWNGKLLTQIVLSAYHNKKITLSDVSHYLGTKIKHIPKLENAVFST